MQTKKLPILGASLAALGVAAFAVDFATGAIYLPGGRRAELDVIPFEGDDVADAIDAVERHRDIDLDGRRSELRIYRLDDSVKLRAQLAAILAGESQLAGGTALAAR